MVKPGVLDPLKKELVYIAVSTANSWSYCVHSHTAAAHKVSLTSNMPSSWRSSAWRMSVFGLDWIRDLAVATPSQRTTRIDMTEIAVYVSG
jgi:AhpD family alkylhydroperoxidase